MGAQALALLVKRAIARTRKEKRGSGERIVIDDAVFFVFLGWLVRSGRREGRE